MSGVAQVRGGSYLSDAYNMSNLRQELTKLGQCLVEICLSVCNLRLVHFYCPWQTQSATQPFLLSSRNAPPHNAKKGIDTYQQKGITTNSDNFEANMPNTKKTWTGINEFSFCRKNNLKTITAIKDPNNKNKLVKDSSHIPNIVNEHFASVGSKLASKIPSSQQPYLDFVSKTCLRCQYLSFFTQ